jgi:hypothetical protein
VDADRSVTDLRRGIRHTVNPWIATTLADHAICMRHCGQTFCAVDRQAPTIAIAQFGVSKPDVANADEELAKGTPRADTAKVA